MGPVAGFTIGSPGWNPFHGLENIFDRSRTNTRHALHGRVGKALGMRTYHKPIDQGIEVQSSVSMTEEGSILQSLIIVPKSGDFG